MRKLFYVLTAALMFFGQSVRADDELKNDTIYFFTHNGCPYCRMADTHISVNHKNLNMQIVNIDMPGGLHLFKKCAEKFNLGRNLGTPLFCMGDEYLMGWSQSNQEKFDELSKKFQK